MCPVQSVTHVTGSYSIGGPFSGYSRSDSVRLTCDLARADEKNQTAAPGAVCR